MSDSTATDDQLDEQTRAVVAEINEDHGLGLSLPSRTADGMQSGAWIVMDRTGQKLILKWSQHGSAERIVELAGIVERVRGAGYPTPAWLAAGATTDGRIYHVQEFALGAPSYPLTSSKADLLLGVLEHHAGLLARDDVLDRSLDVAVAARDESPHGFRHTVRQLGKRGDELINSYDRLLDSYGQVDLPSGDLVHGDFNTCNILLADGQVSSVIDVEDMGRGTRVIDYACLLREAYVADYPDDVKIKVHRAAEAVAGPGVLAVCTAATAFFIVGFKWRHSPELLDFTLASLHRLAADLSRR